MAGNLEDGGAKTDWFNFPSPTDVSRYLFHHPCGSIVIIPEDQGKSNNSVIHCQDKSVSALENSKKSSKAQAVRYDGELLLVGPH